MADVVARTLRDELLDAVEVLAHERAQLQHALRDAASAWTLVAEHVAAQGSLECITTIVDPDDLRRCVSEAHANWEKARHRAQRLLYQLAVLDGESLTAIARQWGVSRQLVSRMVNETDW